MPDLYTLEDKAEHPAGLPRPTAPGASLRATAWFVLLIATLGNSVVSSVGAGVEVHLILGVISVICVGVLIAQRLRSGSGSGR